MQPGLLHSKFYLFATYNLNAVKPIVHMKLLHPTEIDVIAYWGFLQAICHVIMADTA